jgi:uncharacterized membrane protein
MRQLIKNTNADIKMVGAVVGIFITLIISVLVVYTMASGIDYTTANENIAENVYGYTQPGGGADASSWNGTTPATNGSNNILDQAATFFQIAPIIGIVIVAVVILGYVSRIGGT